MNVVFVDDEPKIREGLSAYLKNCPDISRVDAFSSSEVCLDFLSSNAADLLITDIKMPGASGLDLIQELRRIYPKMDIIILSGYGRFDYAKRAIELGVRRFLTKPTNLKELEHVIHEIAVEKMDYPLSDNLMVQKVIQCIHARYMEAITLKDLAEEAFISPNYLCRRFKEVTGTSPLQYLAKLRMDKAAELLLNSPLSVSEIAERVGFSDSRYFSKQFKRWKGQTPQDFRRHHQDSSAK